MAEAPEVSPAALNPTAVFSVDPPATESIWTYPVELTMDIWLS